MEISAPPRLCGSHFKQPHLNIIITEFFMFIKTRFCLTTISTAILMFSERFLSNPTAVLFFDSPRPPNYNDNITAGCPSSMFIVVNYFYFFFRNLISPLSLQSHSIIFHYNIVIRSPVLDCPIYFYEKVFSVLNVFVNINKLIIRELSGPERKMFNFAKNIITFSHVLFISRQSAY